ncbi:peptidylprolyl isomerase, partial [Bartonella sp. AA86SXKL]
KQTVVDQISDADLETLYKKEVAALPKEDEVKARHILVKTKKEAEAIIKRLNKGESFEEIAKKNSTDGSAAVGGDLGYFSHGQMVKPFEDAAFGLKVGEYTKKPVES